MTKILLNEDLYVKVKELSHFRHCLEVTLQAISNAFVRENEKFWQAFMEEHPELDSNGVWKTIEEDGDFFVVPESYLEVDEEPEEFVVEEGENA